ncbi:hypothetical protein [Pseudonocardia sp.]|uniref:hypothetical protein n=1 Tax=Pseudonocardia sp. TaxID=60912 RepID=UPI003D09EC3B
MTLAADPDKIGAMEVEEIGGTLRAERVARGWSLSDAAREIGAVAARTGRRVASAGSLRTQLSRWENGRVAADADSLALLAELYGRPDLRADRQSPPGGPPPSPAGRLRAAVSRADAVDDATLRVLQAQHAVNAELDATLGAAGTEQAVAAQIAQLDSASVHTVDPRRRRAVAGLLAQAALLGGWQALDQDEPDVGFTRHRLALDAARLAGAPALAGQAVAGCAAALLAVGLPAAAEAILAEAPTSGAGGAWARIARAEIRMSQGERDDAARLFDDAAALTPSDEPDADRPTADVPVDGGRTAGVHTGDDTVHDETIGEETIDEETPASWRPGIVPPGHVPPVARRRVAALALYDDAALERLRAGVDEPGLPVRERARLRTRLVLALVARGVRAEAEEQARPARELASTIGSHRERRLLDEMLG